MLTKDLIKYTVRKGKVYPSLIKLDDESALSLAAKMLDVREQVLGKSQMFLESLWEDHGLKGSPYFHGFKKLILDKLEWHEIDPELMERRWEWIREAQDLRVGSLFSDYQAFKETFASSQGQDFTSIYKTIYGDLPEHRKLSKFFEGTIEDLIYRYNCAQVQGLLLKAKYIDLDLSGTSLSEKRIIFRFIKFHQLIVEVVSGASNESLENRKDFKVRIDGPLSVLSNSMTYGLRLANFFPRILHLSNWEMSSKIDLSPSKKSIDLQVKPKKELKSHYRFQGAYLPKEFEDFMGSFNQMSSDWSVKEGETFVHLDEQSFCFPDLTFCHKDHGLVHMELFHKWHKGQLDKRLQFLSNSKARNILLGINRNIFKASAYLKKNNQSQWFEDNCVSFVDFPLPKKILKILSHRISV